MSHSVRARRALAHLPEVDPALASLALWCVHRDGDATETRGDTISYGPGFATLALHEQLGLLGHHVLHVALRHSARMGAMAGRVQGFDGDLFNLAADALVNDTLLLAGHGMPRPCATLEGLLGQGADLAGWDVERLYHHLARDGRDTGKRPRQARDLQPDAGGAEQDREAADWRVRLEQAHRIGRQAGRGIGRATGGLRDLPDPRVPWERHLRGLVARALDAVPRLTHQRPSGTWVAMEAEARRTGRPAPVFQPALRRSALRPRLALGLDTSGSVDDDLLRRFAGEIAGVVRRSGAEVHLLAFDDTVSGAVQLDPATLARQLETVNLCREGGTDFTDVLARAERLGAAMAVILSDMGGDFGVAPRLPVLWAVPGTDVVRAPFGRVVRLDG